MRRRTFIKGTLATVTAAALPLPFIELFKKTDLNLISEAKTIMRMLRLAGYRMTKIEHNVEGTVPKVKTRITATQGKDYNYLEVVVFDKPLSLTGRPFRYDVKWITHDNFAYKSSGRYFHELAQLPGLLEKGEA